MRLYLIEADGKALVVDFFSSHMLYLCGVVRYNSPVPISSGLYEFNAVLYVAYKLYV